MIPWRRETSRTTLNFDGNSGNQWRSSGRVSDSAAMTGIAVTPLRHGRKFEVTLTEVTVFVPGRSAADAGGDGGYLVRPMLGPGDVGQRDQR